MPFLSLFVSTLIPSILHYSDPSRGDCAAEIISIAPIIWTSLCKVSSAYELTALGLYVHFCPISSDASRPQKTDLELLFPQRVWVGQFLIDMSGILEDKITIIVIN